MLPHEFGHFVSPGQDSPDDELTEREVEGLGQAGLVVGRPLMGGRGDDTVGCQGRHEGRYLVDGKISNFGGSTAQWLTHLLLLPDPEATGSFPNIPEIFLMQTNLSFIRDKCCRLEMCLHLIEPNFRVTEDLMLYLGYL